MDIEKSIGNDETLRSRSDSVLAIIDQYEIVRKLGGGGFGSVYLAKDSVSGVEVAVKGLPPVVRNNTEELERIRENFALVARLHHPNIAAALHLHLVRNADYRVNGVYEELNAGPNDTLMVMEYAPGVTLSKWCKQFPGRVVPVDKAIDIVRQVAQALDYAHGRCILHRDIKPSNIMVGTAEDGSVGVRVLDFGLAAEIRSSMGRVSLEVRDTSGTRPYMAPEQWAGEKQGPATDQYALAVLSYELLTGEVPFASAFETGDPCVMMNAVRGITPELKNLPDGMRTVFKKALEKKPDERFLDCLAFVEALEGRCNVRRSKAGLVTGSLLLLAAIGLGVFLWPRHADDAESVCNEEFSTSRDNDPEPNHKESRPARQAKETIRRMSAVRQESRVQRPQDGGVNQQMDDTRCVIGKIAYEFDGKSKTWSVAKCEKDVSGDVTVLNEIKGFKITHIEKEAFRDCLELTRVTLPSSVTFIGEYAFRDCEGLTEVKCVGKHELPHDVQSNEQCHRTAGSIDSAAFYGCKNLKRVMIPPAVTKIGNDVFRDCKGLFEVTIQHGITSIGNSAFYGCGDLKGVNLPLSMREIGEHAFYDCKGLDKLIIPSGVTSIGFCAFQGCDGLKSLVLPSSVRTIATYAFAYCRKLTNVTIPSGKIGNCAFEGCSKLSVLKISPGVTEIGSRAFAGCEGLTRAEISAAASIGERAFSGCGGLANLTISPDVTGIGDGAFYECERLKSVSIPSSVLTIGDNAFTYCKGLKSVTISKGVKTIGSRAFYWCTALPAVTLPSSVENIESGAFEVCSGLTQVTLSQGLTNIEKDVFRGCRSLKSVKIPEGVTDIGKYAFCGCDGLQEVSLPSSVTGIGDYAFSGCRSLTSVTIPHGVVRIDERAFSNCDGLTSVILPASVESLDEEAFDSGVKIIRK